MSRHGADPGLLSSPVRRDIMAVLSNLPLTTDDADQPTRREGMTAAALGAHLHLHVTTIRFHVDQMLKAGLLVAHDVRGGVGRPRRHYTANPAHSDLGTDSGDYEVFAEILAEACVHPFASGALFAAHRAARAWARTHVQPLAGDDKAFDDPIAELLPLLEALDRWGYGPNARITGGAITIELTTCPVEHLASQHPTLVGVIERGLVEGALESLGVDAHLSVVPAGRPGRAVLQLTHAEASRAAG